ncbi:MAG TPA: sigma-70 family RNA polymerase sigma factor [Bryobacteraceae bacterium]|nr:sigma-70 family RNA polymerase sigma factor [Bryobacteraceae bacterium]
MADIAVGLHPGAMGEVAPVSDDRAVNLDAELVEGLRAGAEEAYEALISRFQQPVYNLVYRLTGSREDAGDIVQEVFLKIFRNIGHFRSQSSLKTWIYRITVNEAWNHRRWFSRHQRQETGMVEEEGGRSREDTLRDPGRSPLQLAADHEAHALLEQALTQVNPKFRAAVVLRDIEDLSYEEIASVLDVSLGTVKSRILRGRDALRKNLAGKFDADSVFGLSPQPIE